MKKIIYFLLALIVVSTATYAQDTKQAKGKLNKETTKTAKPAKDVAAKPDAGQGKKLKKDGTPDMRHKENKEAAKPAGKLKKDGTPDMRHKANKEAAKKK
jgi:hypothetical protein